MLGLRQQQAPAPSFPGILVFLGVLTLSSNAVGQNLDVTFRYLPTGVVEAAFVPGQFNGWGQPYNSSGCISSGAPAHMEFVLREPYPAVSGVVTNANYWRKTVSLSVGQSYEYKIQTHRDIAGTQCDWLSDPLNSVVVGGNSNSLLVVEDPMAFQVGEELSGDGTVRYFSAALLSTAGLATISFTVNGVTRDDGLTYYNPGTGIFRFRTERELRSGAQFALQAADSLGRIIEAEIGQIQPPIEWTDPGYSTVSEIARVRGAITRLDGSVDPGLTGAIVLREGGGQSFVPVVNGIATFDASLQLGPNIFRLQATIDGQSFTSDPVTLTRRLHPLDAATVTATVTGAGRSFGISLLGTANLPSDYTVAWSLDDRLSTTTSTWTGSGLEASGVADGSGELYFDIQILADGQLIDQLRIAVVIMEDGTVRALTFEENANWTKKAVVYEIFALQFGPRASGTVTNPGRRLREITGELDYLAEMGFNTIWFMPIMRNRNGMTPVGAGYNIIDFYTVDERLGTNQDFRDLVDRAHELDIRVVLDITPSHVSPDHPWVTSLRNGGPLGAYIQTTPSPHNRGQDGRSANLSEIWQVEGGENLYRKYDGFGDLANLDWDNDDLQAEMLDVLAFWLNEFDVDGFRMDVWWGPLRRYGAERFARPIREVVRRQRPDAWLLGEIAGTGSGTEVYYADAENGTAVTGGLDAAYDWTLYHAAIRGAYGATSSYDFYARNNSFYPGPNARYFRFLENHDENRQAFLHRANPDRLKPLAGFLLTTTGVPMIYAGQEVGFGAAHNYTQRDPVNWEVEGNGPLVALYQRLAQLRQQFPAFWTQKLRGISVARAGEPRVYAFARPYLDQNAVVVINYDDTAASLTFDPSSFVEMSTDGPIPYYDVFADTSASYLGEFRITVPAYGTVVYLTDDHPGFVLPETPPLPFGGINSGATGVEFPEQLRLLPAWPNPLTNQTRIAYELDSSANVRLEVYDVLGRRMAILVSGTRTAGRHEVVFNASGYPSGTYLYRLQVGGQTVSRTMVLAK